MVRDIKFRVWVIEEKKMHTSEEWGFNFFRSDGKSDFSAGPGSGESVYILASGDDGGSILMEYTGIKDKNEKDIYEGDILRLPAGEYQKEYIGVVRFGEFEIISENHSFGELKYMGFYCSSTEGVCYLEIDLFDKDNEIIGNIYENPELIVKA